MKIHAVLAAAGPLRLKGLPVHSVVARMQVVLKNTLDTVAPILLVLELWAGKPKDKPICLVVVESMIALGFALMANLGELLWQTVVPLPPRMMAFGGQLHSVSFVLMEPATTVVALETRRVM